MSEEHTTHAERVPCESSTEGFINLGADESAPNLSL
jgi:hypothetical protein